MQRQHETWSPDALAKIAPLIPNYRGDTEPMEMTRTPDHRLRLAGAVSARIWGSG